MKCIWSVRFLAYLGCVMFLGACQSSGNMVAPLSEKDADKVLHVQATEDIFDEDGERIDTQKLHELWFDPSTGDSHHIIDTPKGINKVDSKDIRVRQGRVLKVFRSSWKHLRTTIATTSDAPMLGGDILLMYRQPFLRGQLPPLGEGTVGNRPAFRVVVFGPIQLLPNVVWLDKETLLPLQEIGLNLEPGAFTATRIWTYTTIEYIARDELPAGIFSIEVPPGTTQVTTHYMTVDESANFDGFDVYYVGETFDSLPIFGINYSEAVGPAYADVTGSDQVPIRRFTVGYAEPFTNNPRRPDQLQLIQEPVSQYRPRERMPGVPAVGETIQVNGQEATLYDEGIAAELELRLGDTFIRISGRNRQLVIQAAESLQRLNRVLYMAFCPTCRQISKHAEKSGSDKSRPWCAKRRRS